MGHGGSIDPGHGLCRNDFDIETDLQVRLQGRLEELDSFIRGEETLTLASLNI